MLEGETFFRRKGLFGAHMFIKVGGKGEGDGYHAGHEATAYVSLPKYQN